MILGEGSVALRGANREEKGPSWTAGLSEELEQQRSSHAVEEPEDRSHKVREWTPPYKRRSASGRSTPRSEVLRGHSGDQANESPFCLDGEKAPNPLEPDQKAGGCTGQPLAVSSNDKRGLQSDRAAGPQHCAIQTPGENHRQAAECASLFDRGIEMPKCTYVFKQRSVKGEVCGAAASYPRTSGVLPSISPSYYPFLRLMADSCHVGGFAGPCTCGCGRSFREPQGP